MEKNKLYFMKKALELAKFAQRVGEVPIGAVLVLNNKIIGKGYNSVINKSDPSAHAEIVALKKAGKKINNYRIIDAEIYVTLEPCLMCYSAMVYARIKKLFFAAFDYKMGIFSTNKFEFIKNIFNHKIEVESGIKQEESSQLLKVFFKERRGAGAVERGGLENR